MTIPGSAPQTVQTTGARTVDLFEIEDFLDAATLAAIVAELHRVGGAPATVLSAQPGGEVRPIVRKVSRLAASPETSALIQQLLLDRKPELEAHFNVALAECEEPQFLRYGPGDFFVAHQDGNTPLVWDDSRFRRVSAVILLSEQSEEPTPETYGGGSLIFHGPYDGPPMRVTPSSTAPGTLITFRSETTHEVTMVTHGLRFSIATWLRGA
jgi:SM-20-related protein